MYNFNILKHYNIGDTMNLEHIMNKDLICKDISTNVDEISKTMKENDIGIIIIKENSNIVGVLTDRDIVTKIISNNDTKIESYITKNLITVDKNENPTNVLNLMKKHKIKRILVTDNNKIVGIISLSDILKYVDSNELKEAMLEIWEINKNIDKYITKIDDFKL